MDLKVAPLCSEKQLHRNFRKISHPDIRDGILYWCFFLVSGSSRVFLNFLVTFFLSFRKTFHLGLRVAVPSQFFIKLNAF